MVRLAFPCLALLGRQISIENLLVQPRRLLPRLDVQRLAQRAADGGVKPGLEPFGDVARLVDLAALDLGFWKLFGENPLKYDFREMTRGLTWGDGG